MFYVHLYSTGRININVVFFGGGGGWLENKSLVVIKAACVG